MGVTMLVVTAFMAPVVSDNVAYVQTRDGDIIAIDINSGNE